MFEARDEDRFSPNTVRSARALHRFDCGISCFRFDPVYVLTFFILAFGGVQTEDCVSPTQPTRLRIIVVLSQIDGTPNTPHLRFPYEKHAVQRRWLTQLGASAFY